VEAGKATSARGDAGVWIAVAWAVLAAPVVFLLLQLPAAAWAALLGYECGCFLASRAAGVSWGCVPRLREWCLWAVGTAAVLVLAWWAVPLFGSLLPQAAPVLARWGMQGTSAGVLLAWYVLVNPWVEEVFWRGTLLGGRCERVLGRRVCLLVSIVGFVPFHLVVLRALFGAQGVWLSLPVLVGSAAWAGMTRWRRSPFPAAISHQVADVAVVVLFLR